MLQHPSVYILIEFVCSVEAYHLLGRMFITIYLFRIQINTQINKEALVLLVNRLITLGIGFFNDFKYLWTFHYSVVDIQQ